MDKMQVFVFHVKFLRAFGNHIPFPHSTQDFNARALETWTQIEKTISGDNGKAISD